MCAPKYHISSAVINILSDISHQSLLIGIKSHGAHQKWQDFASTTKVSHYGNGILHKRASSMSE